MIEINPEGEMSPRALIRSLKIRPKKRLGQHFLIEKGLIRRIVDCVDASAGDLVLEIGAGLGDMSVLLAERGARVISLEVDQQLVAHLKKRLRHYPNIDVIQEDILRYDFSCLSDADGLRLKVVGNLPFNISSQILFKLLEMIGRVELMVLTFQKELCERLVARAGSKDYGILTVLFGLYCDIEKAFVIPSQAFFPRPKVESGVLIFKVLPGKRLDVGSEEVFSRLLKGIFNQRRKTLRRVLANVIRPMFGIRDIEGLLKEVDIDGSRRAETLSLEEFCRISRWICKRPPIISLDR